MENDVKLKLATDTLNEVMRVVRMPLSEHSLIERNETFEAAEVVLAGLEYNNKETDELVPCMQVICPACKDRKDRIRNLEGTIRNAATQEDESKGIDIITDYYEQELK